MLKNFCFSLALLICSSTSLFAQHPKREFRGVWVATVQNIDWPTKAAVGLNALKQQEEFKQILDSHKQTGINAVMLQVRPAADAFYAKSREQWSMFLTGKQGQAPDLTFDPLAFAIEEAHNRGMELHAWFNPYRASTTLNDSFISPDHITRRKPEWFFTYAGKKYFNPGLPEVRDYIVEVILDVVRNYDVDGVHFDDYFYPYPDKAPLPDTLTYLTTKEGAETIEEWRRKNVDLLISDLNTRIHAEKSYVKFGISPFGIWRNKTEDPAGSESNGFSGYSGLYADARKWLQEGWVDYINPQVYFPFQYRPAPYEKLVDWWGANTNGRHLYIGQAAYKANGNKDGWENRYQLPEQVRYLRNNAHVQGSVFFSSRSLTENLGNFRDTLQQELYKYPALPPVMPWLDSKTPSAPQKLQEDGFWFFKSDKQAKLKWEVQDASPDHYGYVIYRFESLQDVNLSDASKIVNISFDKTQTRYEDTTVKKGRTYYYLITSIDRLKNESIPSNIIKVKF